MTSKPMSQSQSIYCTILSTILLCYKLSHILACPLPSGASCDDCHILRQIQFNSSLPLNINLTMKLDVVKSQNTITEFVRNINNDDSYTFQRTPLTGPVRDCYGSDPNAGSPCTDYIEMEGERRPKCTWNYTCDYSPNRIPQYLWRARCDKAPPGYREQEILYEIPTLTLTSASEHGCLPFYESHATYKWDLETVTVACACIPTE